MKKVKNFIADNLKDIDMFGHPIEFNFNKSGSSHNTLLGGFFSFFIRLGLTLYVFLIFEKMFFFRNNTERNATFTLLMDPDADDSFANVKWSSLKTTIFLVLRFHKSDHSKKTFEDFKQYVTPSAIQIDTDWNKIGTDDFIKETPFETKPCTLEDFGDDAADYFYSWNGFMLLCPSPKN